MTGSRQEARLRQIGCHRRIVACTHCPGRLAVKACHPRCLDPCAFNTQTIHPCRYKVGVALQESNVLVAEVTRTKTVNLEDAERWSAQATDNDDIGDGMDAIFGQEWGIAESCLRRDIGRNHWLARL